MSTKVKICGITCSEDARMVVSAGADLIGFVFYENSPRCVTLECAATICRHIPPYVLRVGLFVNASPKSITEAIQHCGLQMLQFHGDESPEFCRQFGLMTMKAFRVKGPESLENLSLYNTDAWLLDANVAGKYGGTGQTFDWQLAALASQRGRPLFLAGGLNPENVAEAIRIVRPYGVDVSGGVETEPGRKDPKRVRAFISAARESASSPG